MGQVYRARDTTLHERGQGRESIETAYALKQLVTAGVRVFFYLENRERTLESPTDKLLLSVTAFADEMEREKARQRNRSRRLKTKGRGARSDIPAQTSVDPPRASRRSGEPAPPPAQAHLAIPSRPL